VKKLIFEAKTAECSGKAARSAAILSAFFIPFKLLQHLRWLTQQSRPALAARVAGRTSALDCKSGTPK